MNLNDVRENRLPPEVRQGPTRVLFISAAFLGFGEYYRRLVQYTAVRDDIDAVHIEVQFPLWTKILGKSLPFDTRGWDFHSYRHLLMWRGILRRWFRTALDLRRFDVVHIMTQGIALGMLDVRTAAPTKWMLNIDGTAAQDVSDFGYSRIARAPFIAAERRMFAAADSIACRNAWAAESLVRDYQVDTKRIIVARSGQRLPEKSRLDFPPRARGELVRLVFVGNAWRRKGGAELLEIHQRHFSDIAELHVFSKDASSVSRAKNVIWHRGVSNDVLIQEHLPQMDIFVLPTKVDQLPRSIVEAGSVGLPLISTRMAGIPEIIVDGQTGILCDRGDWRAVTNAIRYLIENEDVRLVMGRNAREHVANEFNPDVIFNKLIDHIVALPD